MSLFSSTGFSFILNAERKSNRLIKRLLFRLLSLNKISLIYEKYRHLPDKEFIDGVLNELKIKWVVPDPDLLNIPTDRSVIFVANHPFGLLDGMLLLDLFYSRVPNVKILGHSMLKKFRPLNRSFIFVDPAIKMKSFKQTLREGKKLHSHFLSGSSLIIFPSGRVNSFSFRNFKVVEKQWSDSIVKWIIRSKYDVVPIFIQGNNSLIFHVLNYISENIGFLCAGRELLLKKGKKINIKIGRPIIINSNNAADLSSQIREEIFALKHN